MLMQEPQVILHVCQGSQHLHRGSGHLRAWSCCRLPAAASSPATCVTCLSFHLPTSSFRPDVPVLEVLTSVGFQDMSNMCKLIQIRVSKESRHGMNPRKRQVRPEYLRTQSQACL